MMISSMCMKPRRYDSLELCVLKPGHSGDHDFQAPLPNEIADPDAEVEAISQCVRVLWALDYNQLRRVFDYLARRFLDVAEQDRAILNREISRLEELIKERGPQVQPDEATSPATEPED